MLKKHNEFFKGLLIASDLFFVSLAWWSAYYLRFYTSLFSEPEGFIFRHYATAWVINLGVWLGVLELLDFYRPRRISTLRRETKDLFKGSTLALLIFLATIFVLRELVLSRIVVILFWFFGFILLNFSHVVFRKVLRALRRRGYNLRQTLIIGTPPQVLTLEKRIKAYRHLGLQIFGVYFTEIDPVSSQIETTKVIKSQEELITTIRRGFLDQVFVTLPLEQAAKLIEIQEWLGDEPVAIHFVPDLKAIALLRGNIEEFDGLPLISLQSSPFYGWNALQKRSLDLIIGVLALIAFFPVMIIIAVLIKLTSPGPVIYRQERMGLDVEPFIMLKFRTMVMDAEKDCGPVWAAAKDPRITWLGRWLRYTSLDELPQLINVLRGEMSLVGPRPERRPFIEEFRKSMPKYMLRHKVKAGMTGWAQIHGWRGNTSLQRRLEYDLDYIEHWSLSRDLKILLLTLCGGFRDAEAAR